MSKNALRCSLTVVAGILPGEPMPEYTRRWDFTEEQMRHQSDGNILLQYADAQGAAMNYALGLQIPSIANWVEMTWIWY